MNATAIATFIFAGQVHWKQTIVAGIAAIIGGYVGIHAARRLPQSIVKGFVIGVGLRPHGLFFHEDSLMGERATALPTSHAMIVFFDGAGGPEVIRMAIRRRRPRRGRARF